jgi:hypothetical protein
MTTEKIFSNPKIPLIGAIPKSGIITKSIKIPADTNEHLISVNAYRLKEAGDVILFALIYL